MSDGRQLTCAYCGYPIAAGGACPAHRDLERLDPHRIAGGAPLSESQLGVKPWWRLRVRSGRRRL